jgi:hypothetical protein
MEMAGKHSDHYFCIQATMSGVLNNGTPKKKKKSGKTSWG